MRRRRLAAHLVGHAHEVGLGVGERRVGVVVLAQGGVLPLDRLRARTSVRGEEASARALWSEVRRREQGDAPT